MSGVWVFKDGVVRVVNPGRGGGGGDSSGGGGGASGGGRHRVLVYVPTDEVITSYVVLESKLAELGWERYHGGGGGGGPGLEMLQFHKPSSVHLISVPADFSKFRSVHMYDIVVKSRNVFKVRVVQQRGTL